MAERLQRRKRKRNSAFQAEDRRQAERLTKLARELETDETGAAFQRALQILKKRHPTKH